MNDYIRKKIFTVSNFIILINVIVFIITEISGYTNNAYTLYKAGALTPLSLFKEHEIYRIFTSMFLHSGTRHIFNNMFMLFFVGNALEGELGKVKYLILYLLSGVISGIISQFYYYNIGEEYVVCVGASGAIFGVIGALIWLLIINKGYVGDLSLGRMILYVVVSIALGMSSTNVSVSAHVGGLIGGFVLAVPLYRKRGYTNED